jgi:Rap1a immunity proteins
MKTIFAALGIVAALATNPAVAASDGSANYYLPGCREFASPHPILSDQLNQGECIGIIEALRQMSWLMPPTFQSCAPDGVTNLQLAVVVVRWLDQHPQRWNENFQYLTLEALREAWPCK